LVNRSPVSDSSPHLWWLRARAPYSSP